MRLAKFLIFGLTLGLLLDAYAYEDNDFQVWNTEVEEFKVSREGKVAFEQEFRWGGQARELYYQHYDVGYFHDLTKYLNAGLGYRHVLSKNAKNKFLIENEPYLNLTFFWDLKGFKFDDRSRLELNHYDYKRDSARYRNKLTVRAPWKLTKFQIQPYLYDEIFFVLDNDEKFTTNRLSCGLTASITKNFKAELYYMLQSSKGTQWTDANILGTKFKLVF